jgi:hypothetical protein
MNNLVTVGSKKGKKRHLVDADKYNRLSRSKALCGISGSALIQFDAAYFNYELVYPIMCKACQAKKDAAHP